MNESYQFGGTITEVKDGNYIVSAGIGTPGALIKKIPGSSLQIGQMIHYGDIQDGYAKAWTTAGLPPRKDDAAKDLPIKERIRNAILRVDLIGKGVLVVYDPSPSQQGTPDYKFLVMSAHLDYIDRFLTSMAREGIQARAGGSVMSNNIAEMVRSRKDFRGIIPYLERTGSKFLAVPESASVLEYTSKVSKFVNSAKFN